MGILQAVAPISIELANPTMLVESPFASYRDDEDGVPGTSEQAPLTGMDAGEQQTNVNSRVFYRFNMFTLATMIWVIGASLFITFEILRGLYWRRKVWRWREELSDPIILRILAEEKERQHYTKEIRCFVSPTLKTPLVTGLFHHRLLLPENMPLDEDTRMVIRHEIAHLSGRDIAKKLVLMVIRCIHWFNPLAWIMINRANKDIELACDERVVDGGDDAYRLAYSETLLKCAKLSVSSVSPAFSTCFGSDKKSLLERFQNILNTGKRYKGRIAVAVLFVVALIIINLVFISPARRQTTQLIAPDTGGNFSVWVDNQPERIVATTIAAPTFWSDDDVPSTYSSASFGSLLSIACAPGTISDDAISLYTTSTEGRFWNESQISTAAHIDFVGGSVFHGYTSKQFGYVFAVGASGQLSNQGVYLYQTIDGGANWHLQNYISNEHLVAVSAGFIDEYIGFICYTAKEGLPYALVTYDSGKSWQPVEGIEELVIDASDNASESVVECISANFVDGAKFVYADRRTGEIITLYSPDSKNWAVEGS